MTNDGLRAQAETEICHGSFSFVIVRGRLGCNWKWESIHAPVNSPEAVENLIRVNSWNSWPLYFFLFHEFHENDHCHLDVIGLKYNFFAVSPAALPDSHF